MTSSQEPSVSNSAYALFKYNLKKTKERRETKGNEVIRVIEQEAFKGKRRIGDLPFSTLPFPVPLSTP
jgi:hypothetical protein